MIDSQRASLENRTGQYLNIGITEGGMPRMSIRVPWKRTASAYNMRIPDVYLAPEDLGDPEIMALLEKFCIRGCYIFVTLPDYHFLRNFRDIWDLHIYNGVGITDISFMQELKEWSHFYLEDACLENLEALFPKDGKRRLRSYCLGLVNCRVNDISALEQENVRLSELYILQPEGTNERDRWKHVHASDYSYYEYR